MNTNDEELKQLIACELDPLSFLDACGISFEELIDLVFPELNEEQRQELERITAS